MDTESIDWRFGEAENSFIQNHFQQDIGEMYLRDFATMIAHGVALPSGLTALDFRNQIYHVRETFFVHLSRAIGHNHFLPEASKVVIFFGPDPNGNDYFCCLSVAQCWITDFEFITLSQLDQRDQETHLLSNITDRLRFVAERQGVDTDAIDRAADATLQSEFVIRYEIRKLSKFHPNRKLRFNVVREIHPGGESWYIELRNQAGDLLDSLPIKLNTDSLFAGQKFRKAVWRKDTFTILDNRGRTSFRKGTKALVKKFC